MIASVLESLFGTPAGNRPGMGGILLHGARVLAWMDHHRATDVEHVVHTLGRLVDVRRALEVRGVHADDMLGVTTQLLADLPRHDPAGPDVQPAYSARLANITNATATGGVVSTPRFIAAIAGALPAELEFVRRPLSGCAAELGATFDAPLSSKGGGLTFEVWDTDLRACLSLMQRFTDKNWQSWTMEPVHLFLSLLSYKPYFAYFKGRGHDPVALIRDFAASVPEPTWDLRVRPAGLDGAFGPALYALVIRTERYAASDATDVRLRHLLLALHDEPTLAPWIDRLAG